MRLKKPFRNRPAVGIFFIGTFFAFCRKYKDRDELQRIGVTFSPTDRVQIADSRQIQALLFASTRPEVLANLDEYDEDFEPWHNETRTLFFVCYAKAPKFVCALLEHFRRKANAIRAFMSTAPKKFIVGGRTLTMEIATDGEVAQAIRAKFGVAVTKDAVKRERQFLSRVSKQPWAPPKGDDPRRCDARTPRLSRHHG